MEKLFRALLRFSSYVYAFSPSFYYPHPKGFKRFRFRRLLMAMRMRKIQNEEHSERNEEGNKNQSSKTLEGARSFS